MAREIPKEELLVQKFSDLKLERDVCQRNLSSCELALYQKPVEEESLFKSTGFVVGSIALSFLLGAVVGNSLGR